MQELQSYIQGYFGIKQESLQQVSELFFVDTISKEDYFVRKNKHCKKLSFLKSGYLRVYDETEKKSVTQWIASANYFVTDLSSIVFDVPARWNIQAITDCELYSISSENYRRIGELVPEWNQLEKLFIARCFTTLEERVFSFLSMTAQERYIALYQQNSQLFNEVPLHFLASMLGMSPETLSRIRKEQSQK